MSWQATISQSIQAPIIQLFDSLNQLTGVFPSVKTINNLTKRTIGTKIFQWAPSDYDSREEIVATIYTALKTGFKDVARANILELKKRNDVEGLKQVSQILQFQINQKLQSAKRKPSDYPELVSLLDLAKLIDPTYEQKLTETLKPEQAKAIQETRKFINYLNNASNVLNTATLVSFGSGLLLRGLVSLPIVRSALIKSLTGVITHGATGALLAGSMVAEAKKADVEGRNPLTILLDPFSFAVAYDAISETRKALKHIPKQIVAKDMLSDDYLSSVETMLYNNVAKRTEVEDIRKKVSQTIALLDKIRLSASENILSQIQKQVGTDNAVALHKAVSLLSEEVSLAKELQELTKHIYSKDEVVKFLEKKKTKNGFYAIDANEVEQFLDELAKSDAEVRRYLEIQRIVSLSNAFRRAIQDNARYINVIQPDTGKVVYTIDLTQDTVQSVYNKIKDTLDEVGEVVLTWNSSDKPVSMVLKSAYHPSVDDFITLDGFFIIKSNVAEGALKGDELRNALKELRLSDDLIKNIVDEIGDSKAVVLRDNVIIPNSALELGRDALETVLKQRLRDENAKLLFYDFDVVLNPIKIFPYKLRALSDRLRRISSKLRKQQEVSEKEITDVLNLARKLNLIDEVPDVKDKEALNTAFQTIRKNLTDRLKQYRQTIKEGVKTKFVRQLYKEYKTSLPKLIRKEFRDYRNDVKLLSSVENSLIAISNTLLREITTPSWELRRIGRGFATYFKSYDDLVDYASTHAWNRLYPQLEISKVFRQIRDYLERLPNRNQAQEMLLRFIRLVEGRSESELKDKALAVSKFLGSVYTMFNLPTALGNAGQYIAVSSVLFPSLKLFNPINLNKYSDELTKAFKELALAKGVYKYHLLNPFVPMIQATLRATIKASIETDDGLKAVLKDYARFIAKETDEVERIADDLFEFYKNRRELLVEDLEKIISGIDPRVLGTVFMKYAETGELIVPWYRFIFTPLTFSLQALKQLPIRLSEGDLRALGKAFAVSTLLAVAVGSEAVPYFAPIETGLGIAKDLANLIEFLFNVDAPDVVQNKDLKNAVLSTIANEFGMASLDPKSKEFLFENIGKEVAEAVFGTEARGNNVFADILERGLNIFFNLSQVGVVSRGAMSFGFEGFSDLPSPVLQFAKSVFRELFTSEKKEPSEALVSIFETLLPHTVPIGRELIYLTQGRILAKGLPVEIRDYLGITEKLAEIPTEELYKTIGAGWLVGFVAQFWDGAFTSFFFTHLLDALGGQAELTQSFRVPSEAEYYKVISLRDSSILKNENYIPYLTALIKKAEPEHKEMIYNRLFRLAEITVFGRTKNEAKALEKLILSEDFESKKKAIENFITIYERTKDYLTPESRKLIDERIKYWLDFLSKAEQIRKSYAVE